VSRVGPEHGSLPEDYDCRVPGRETLRLYGQPSKLAKLPWEWVDQQLSAAGTYWVVPQASDHPHPRPVWGIWHGGMLQLSVGSPAIVRALQAQDAVVVHLDSGTDVVIVEGRRTGSASEPAILGEYERKYGRAYDPAEFGPLITVTPEVILAWRAAGWAGKDSFQQAGRWDFRSR
jgi:hypothetical protein